MYETGVSAVQIIPVGYFCARYIFNVSNRIGIYPIKLRSKVIMGSKRAHLQHIT